MVHSELGLLLIRMGQWQPALTEMRAAVVCTPGSALFHFDLAAVYTPQAGSEASVEYEKALEIDPDYFEANLTYARLPPRARTPEPTRLFPKLIRAVKATPDSEQAHRSLADAYQRLGQTENAAREEAAIAVLKDHSPE